MELYFEPKLVATVMGRVRRYKKVKSHDPFYRGPRKDVSGINLCPVNEDDQPVPKSLIRLMKGAELLKKGQQEKRPIPAHSEPPNSTAHGGISTKSPTAETSGRGASGGRTRECPMFVKKKGESLKNYLERIDMESNARIMEAYRKNRKPSDRRKRYLDERRMKAVARRKGLSQDLALEFNDLKDEVRFGEVVQAPPQLQAKPRGSQSKPSHSKLLLLHQKITQDSAACKPKTRTPTAGLRRKQDLEIERERVISVYRQRKKATHKTFTKNGAKECI